MDMNDFTFIVGVLCGFLLALLCQSFDKRSYKKYLKD